MSDNVNPPLVVLAQSYPDRKNPKKAIVKAAHNILFPQIVLYGAEYYVALATVFLVYITQRSY